MSQRELSLTIADLRKKDRETNLELKSLLVEIGQKNLQLAALSEIDFLTGLYNRKYYTDHLKATSRICAREKKRLVVVMMDIDHFKSVNDEFGHAAGDDCLKMIGLVLKAALERQRAGDFVARYGGEEFVLVFYGASMDWAEKNSNEIRKQIQAKKVKTINRNYDPIEISITISMGIASSATISRKELLLSPEKITRKADSIMYEAKRQGRNCVICEPYPGQSRLELNNKTFETKVSK